MQKMEKKTDKMEEGVFPKGRAALPKLMNFRKSSKIQKFILQILDL